MGFFAEDVQKTSVSLYIGKQINICMYTKIFFFSTQMGK